MVVKNKKTSRDTNKSYQFSEKANSMAGIRFTKTTKKSLLDNISNLKFGARKNLYFIYSDYFLRSHRNKYFRNIFRSDDNIYATDGKGVEWASYRLKDKISLNQFNKATFYLPLIKLFYFIFNCIYNIFHGFYIAFSKTNTFPVTHNKLIKGRDFKEDLLDLAIKKNWKTLIAGSFDEDFTKKMQRIYPNLDLSLWSLDSKSDFMRDESKLISEKEKKLESFAKVFYKHELIDDNNLLKHYPQFESLVNLLKGEEFDLILLAIGGASGKQEFFMEYLKNQTNVKYTVCAGLGAAFDHLGGGKKQLKAPEYLQDIGLEWLFRIFTNPARISRVVDSIISFWLLVSKYPLEIDT